MIVFIVLCIFFVTLKLSDAAPAGHLQLKFVPTLKFQIGTPTFDDMQAFWTKAIQKKDPSAALGLPKMASQDAAARDRSQERSHVAYARAAEPDAGIPAHVALTKQLHSGTGYNLVIDTEGKVYGTREPYNKEAIMEVTARVPGEVQIRAKQSKFYLAMDERGKIYAEEDEESPNIWFKEIYEDGWNYYIWLGNNKEWFLGINKNGKMKHGPKTKKKQKSVKFVPRSATPTYN